MKMVNHPNVIGVKDVFATQTKIFIVLELGRHSYNVMDEHSSFDAYISTPVSHSAFVDASGGRGTL